MKFSVFVLLQIINLSKVHCIPHTLPFLNLTQYKYQPFVKIVDKTVGLVWPQPQYMSSRQTVLSLNPESFRFVYDGPTDCEVLNGTLERYSALIFSPPRQSKHPSPFTHNNVLFASNELRGQLASVKVTLAAGSCDQWPSQNMNELYTIKINTDDLPQAANIVSISPWGVIRGLETFSQLVYKDKTSGMYLVNSTLIIDFPRFSHRGVMLDTSRHFVAKRVILQNLDAMSYNKFNVFHWHIVDDPSFPYQSTAFPQLSEKGAYEPENHIYTQDDVKEILDYARRRGIRVVPEFDSPGHTSSWGRGIPDLLTQCYAEEDDKVVPNGFGPINPIVNTTYEFLQTLFEEIANVFVDQYVHLGGDEVSFDCWKSNPDIALFFNQSNFTGYNQVEALYITKLLDLVSETGKSYIVWQEVVDNGVAVKDDTVVEVWMGGQEEELAKVTSLGYTTLLASCWYLDYISYGSDWKKYYACDPQEFNGTDSQKELVIGGEVCLWGEFVDGSNLISRMWPRASAAAERLWSNASMVDVDSATPRLEEHRCRLLSRGINAEPQNGASFCDVDYLVQ